MIYTHVLKVGGGGVRSPFQAFMTALAVSIGTGNIAGVATAVVSGGPGAVFWIWCYGFVATAVGCALALRIAGFGTSGLILRGESGVIIAYAMPALVFALACIHALKPDFLITLLSRSKKQERAA